MAKGILTGLLILAGCVYIPLPLDTAPPQQPACAPLVLPAPPAGVGNLFTPEQEVDLGDITAEFAERRLEPIEDEALAGYLRAVGERLVAHLPPTGLRFRFYLSDLPQANAMSLAGGRVYVTRKLVAFARSEDEVAGVMAHELGHIVTHQHALEFSRWFREVGITEIGNRRDLLEKFHRLLESAAKLKSRPRGEEMQLEADKVGVELALRAGYAPQASADFFDRVTETKGKTGSWWSDFWQTTRPESRRLRELLKSAAPMPAGCPPTRAPKSEGFESWRGSVSRWMATDRRESLRGVVWRRMLQALREDFHTLRFSPDGRYVLAQDSASIYVLTRQPFQSLFRIDAPGARSAQFTPDSRAVVFYTPGLRVERWDLAMRQRTDVSEVVLAKGCFQTRLAPDGRTLACLTFEHDLLLLAVETGERLLERKRFYTPHADWEWGIDVVRLVFQVRFVNLAFSPDARYFVAAAPDGTAVALDVNTRQEVPLRGGAKQVLGLSFTFVGPDQVLGSAGTHGERSVLARFPSGELVKRLDLGSAEPAAVTRGHYILLRPIRDYAVGVLDLESDQIVRASKTEALDAYEDVFVSQLRSGELGLFGASAAPLATLALPRGPIGWVHAGSVSDDLSWLAASVGGRGAVWNLSTGEMLYNLRGFRDAWFARDSALYAEFPKEEKIERSLARIQLSPRAITEAQKLEDSDTQQHGGYLVTLHNASKSKKSGEESGPPRPSTRGEGLGMEVLELLGQTRRNAVLGVRALSGAELWSHAFPKEVPAIYWAPREDRVVFRWPASEGGAKAELERLLEMRQRLGELEEHDNLLEVVELSSGKVLGLVGVNTHEGTFTVGEVDAAGDYVVVKDSFGRLLVYRVSDGQLVRRLVGRYVALLPAERLLCIERERNRLLLYDLVSGELRGTLAFAAPLALVQPAGKRLFALTTDQVAYLLDPAAAP